MKRDDFNSQWRDLLSARAWLTMWIPILLISAAHYTTSAYHHWLHDVFRRLYYIPIVLGAFGFGLKGALSASIVASLIYSPHAFTYFFVQDPTSTIEKTLELLLYNIVAAITGSLAEREKLQRLKQEDISARLKETIEEMKLLEEQLIRAGRLQALGELTAGLAHEIKNPLASIKGASEIIGDEIPENSPRRKMVDIQKKELIRLENLLEKFLSFARPGKFEVAALDLREVVEHVASLVEPQSRKSGVRLIHERRNEAAAIRGDREKLSQVAINLILNAVDASPPDSEVLVSIVNRTKGRKSYLALDIEDQGPGVPDAIKEKVFNPFFTTKNNGSGLGLSIALKIADEHSGFLDVTNRPGGGARFSLYLPFEADGLTDTEVKK